MKNTRLSLPLVAIASSIAIASSLAIACAAKGGEAPPPEAPAPAHEHAEHAEGAGAPEAAPTVAPEGDAAEAERLAYEKARPVFEKYCVKCHTTGGPKANKKALKHLVMDSYPFGGHHAEDVTVEIRKVLGATGKKPTMPSDEPGTVQGEELQLILAWADAYDRAHATAGAPAQHEHEHEHEHEH